MNTRQLELARLDAHAARRRAELARWLETFERLQAVQPRNESWPMSATSMTRQVANPANLRGKRYNSDKEAKGGDRGNQYTVAKDQNDPLPESTADRLATEYKVSAPTIKRDGQYAAARFKRSFREISELG